MIKNTAATLPVILSLMLLSACSGTKEAPVTSGGAAQQQTTHAPVAPQKREMQPLQPGQPAQKQPKSVMGEAIQGGNPGTTPLPFGQTFRLADLEYKFGAARAKGFVGLETNPSMKPAEGNTYFLVRYLVCNNGNSQVTVPNNAAVHLLNTTTKQVNDIDQAATNANVQSGAATGMPDQLVLQPGEPNMQSLAFQVPATADPTTMSLLVTEPKDPTHVFQIVKLSN